MSPVFSRAIYLGETLTLILIPRVALRLRYLVLGYRKVRQDPPLTLIEPLTLSETRSAKACPYAF